jgi:hypothetical protein
LYFTLRTGAFFIDFWARDLQLRDIPLLLASGSYTDIFRA